MTISGTRSSLALMTTLTALLKPGPTVATSTGGVPVRCQTASAMKPAAVSCLVVMKVMPALPSASMTVSTSPPGMPKANRQPASASRRASWSAARSGPWSDATAVGG